MVWPASSRYAPADVVEAVGVARVEERLTMQVHPPAQPRAVFGRVLRHLLVGELEPGDFAMVEELEDLCLLRSQQTL